ncbi:MAG TPA: PAS domain-containing protein [Kiloniellaceae bacterium]|nr:PAS domain-containing protein [Kiloniellaceae bacterium]
MQAFMVMFESVERGDRPPAGALALLELWRQYSLEKGRPTRSDFTPFVLKPWLGSIDIYDVEGGGATFRMRLNGTRVVAITGEDWKGKTAHDVDRRYGGTLHEELARVYRSREPLAHHIRIFQKDYILAYRLLLPIFSDEQPGAVAQIFLAVFNLDA